MQESLQFEFIFSIIQTLAGMDPISHGKNIVREVLLVLYQLILVEFGLNFGISISNTHLKWKISIGTHVVMIFFFFFR